MLSKIIEHCMRTDVSNVHVGYLDSGDKLKIVRIAECFSLLAEFAECISELEEGKTWQEIASKRPALIRFVPRMVLVPEDSGITTDQNANAWLNGVEWKDIIVDGRELSRSIPAPIREVAYAARAAADRFPLAARA